MDLNISPACLPPVQPRVTEEERRHPRYPEYRRYLAAMDAQLVTGCAFKLWVEQFDRPQADDDLDWLDSDEALFYVPGRGLVPESKL